MRDYLGCLILNLKETFPPDSYLFKSKDECLAELRRMSGLDHADDIDAWEAWVLAQKMEFRKRADTEIEQERGE